MPGREGGSEGGRRRRRRRRRKALLHHQRTQVQEWAGCADDSHQLPQHFQPCSSTLCTVCKDQEITTHIYTYTIIYTALHRPPFCPAELPVYAKDNWPNGLSLPLQLNTEWGGCSPPALEYWLTSVWTQQPFTRSHQSKDVRTECLFWEFFSFFWLWNLNTSVLCSVCRNAPPWWLKKCILYNLTFKAVVIESRFWLCPARLVTCLWFWKRADRQG